MIVSQEGLCSFEVFRCLCTCIIHRVRYLNTDRCAAVAATYCHVTTQPLLVCIGIRLAFCMTLMGYNILIGLVFIKQP